MNETALKYEILIVPTDQVLAVWHIVRKMLVKGIEKSSGRWNLEYVLAELVLGRQALWAVREIGTDNVMGSATTGITQYPNKRMLTMHFLGGEGIDEWYPDCIETMLQYGRDSGCSVVETIGREGLWKWYKTSGFEKNGICYEKKL